MSAAGPPLNLFYGDDFTGTMSTAEIFTAEGVATLVFTRAPTLEALRAKYPGVQAVGVAGTARSEQTPALERILPPVFGLMRDSGAASLLYKVCSTFDSAPQVGSIGRAIEIAFRMLPNRRVAVVPAAPRFGRFVAFGNLFATAGGSEVFRLDRHPSMSVHPVTPMDEADLLRHLGRQTELPAGLVDIRTVAQGREALRSVIGILADRGDRLLLFDGLAMEHLVDTCAAVLDSAGQGVPPLFVGSHEVAYGLAAWFRERGMAAGAPAAGGPELRRERSVKLLAVSGSCTPVTSGQIEWARSHGFAEVAVRPELLLSAGSAGGSAGGGAGGAAGAAGEEQRIAAEAAGHLGRGSSVIVHSALGPEDPRVRASRADAPLRIRLSLGRITRGILSRSDVQRLVVMGGDTSGAVLEQLGVSALQVIASIPGAPAPLCRAFADDPRAQGLEIALKGGQVGVADYLGTVRQLGTGRVRAIGAHSGP